MTACPLHGRDGWRLDSYIAINQCSKNGVLLDKVAYGFPPVPFVMGLTYIERARFDTYPHRYTEACRVQQLDA